MRRCQRASACVTLDFQATAVTTAVVFFGAGGGGPVIRCFLKVSGVLDFFSIKEPRFLAGVT